MLVVKLGFRSRIAYWVQYNSCKVYGKNYDEVHQTYIDIKIQNLYQEKYVISLMPYRP